MISTSFSLTTDRWDAFARGLAEEMEPDKQQVLYDALALKFLELVMAHNDTGTPVDTGRARAGWSRALESLGGRVESLGSDDAAIADGKRKGSTGSGNGKTSAHRWLHNGVEYIAYLEYGSSDQAPGGFIRVNLESMRGDVRGEALVDLRDKLASANAKARATGLRWKGATR